MTRIDSILSLLDFTGDQQAAVTTAAAAISVTAGAGSGKTRALVGRYLALLEGGAPLRSLVAITFTEKAAREMRNRIRSLATAWLKQLDSASDQARWQEIFSALDAARISTIHSLCAAILRAHPAEAGLDPAFGVLDEGQSAVWQGRAVEEGLAWATTEVEVVPLFNFFKEAELRRLLADLLARRLEAAPLLLPKTAEGQLAGWSQVLAQWFAGQLAHPLWQESLDTLAAVQARAADDKLELARREVLACWAEAHPALAERRWEAFFAALPALRQAIASSGQQGNWAGDDLAAARAAMRSLRDHYDQRLSPLLDPKKPVRWQLDQQTADLLPLVGRLFAQTQAIYQAYKVETHLLDFDDLEALTVELLTRCQAVRNRWQQEIKASLLVDEFQDTNQRQREIVYALAGFNETAPASPAKGSALFIVGDAKQSIYRFRGADVTVFRQVQADIDRAGGTRLNFDLTFRAHQPLVELTNALLAPLMAAADDPDRPYDVPFAPLMAHRDQPKLKPPYLEFHLGLGEDKAAGRAAAAASLANRLAELRRAGQLEWPEVALLFRASTAFGVYEDALEQAGIPFVTVAGRGFYDRPEIRDLLNALAAIADPADDLALAGLLRSPAIGLSDGGLHLLRLAGSTPGSLWASLQKLADLPDLSPADREQAEFARQLVAKLHRQAGRVTVAQLLKAFLDATHYPAALRLVADGERLRRNVDKLLTDAHRSELVSIGEFLEYISTLRDVGARQSEAPTEAGGAVQLMTIHKAKGLEFPVVVLADAGYSGGARAAPFYLDQELGLLLNLTDGEAQPAAFRLAAWRETEQQAAEERRLLYVAATRAREKLIISGDAKISTAKTNPGRLLLGGWLAQLAAVVGLSQLELPTPPSAPQAIALAWQNGAAACTLYPPDHPVLAAALPATPPVAASPERPDLLGPVAVAASDEVDDKLRDRDSDPPRRVWRVAPPTPYDVPAWVVGSLTHTALRYWRFPNEPAFADFLRPFALEAGLTDANSIDTALQRVSRLLIRFQAHPLYAELAAAERHHELPYSLSLDGQLQSGLIDLLCRPGATLPQTPVTFKSDRYLAEAAWTIVEFKTDRLAEGADLPRRAQAEGYDRQVAIYRQAVSHLLGVAPRVLLVFLNVGQSVQVLNL